MKCGNIFGNTISEAELEKRRKAQEDSIRQNHEENFRVVQIVREQENRNFANIDYQPESSSSPAFYFPERNTHSEPQSRFLEINEENDENTETERRTSQFYYQQEQRVISQQQRELLDEISPSSNKNEVFETNSDKLPKTVLIGIGLICFGGIIGLVVHFIKRIISFYIG